MALYFKCLECGDRDTAYKNIPTKWVEHPAWCNWCRTHKIGGGWMTLEAPPLEGVKKVTKDPIKVQAPIVRVLNLLRASMELPPDAGWECVAKAREILEREVEE